MSAPPRVTAGDPPVCVHAKASAPPSGSVLPLPSRVTEAPSPTERSFPAFAVGGALYARTVTVTVSLADRPPESVTVNRNVRTASVVTCGVVKVGVAVLAPLRVTLGDPPVCVHAKVSAPPSGSVLPPPSSVTDPPSSTVRWVPALASGASLSARTVTVSDHHRLHDAVGVRRGHREGQDHVRRDVRRVEARSGGVGIAQHHFRGSGRLPPAIEQHPVAGTEASAAVEPQWSRLRSSSGRGVRSPRGSLALPGTMEGGRPMTRLRRPTTRPRAPQSSKSGGDFPDVFVSGSSAPSTAIDDTVSRGFSVTRMLHPRHHPTPRDGSGSARPRPPGRIHETVRDCCMDSPGYAQSSACAPGSMETRAPALRKPVTPAFARMTGNGGLKETICRALCVIG